MAKLWDEFLYWARHDGLLALALTLQAFLFGVVLKISDLLQEHGFKWFKGSANFAGLVNCGQILAILFLCNDAQRLFWLAVCLQWILRARIDGVNHGIFTMGALVYFLYQGPSVVVHSHEFIYFLGILSVMGLLHDLYQYTNAPAPAWFKWFLANQHLYYYMVAVGYWFVFAHDYTLIITVWGFVKGYGWLYDERRYRYLAWFGIKQAKPDPHASPAAA